MAHELDFSTGDAAFVQFGDRVTAWHRLGRTINPTEFENLPTQEKTRLVLERGRLLWTVEPQDVFAQGGGIIPGWKAFRRSDTDKLMGVFPESYTVIQNEDLFRLVEPMVDVGMATFETAGVLREGEDVWALFRFNPQDPAVVDFFADRTIPYLLLSNNHARKRLLSIMETLIEVVCANTLGAALGIYGKKRRAGRYPGAVLLRHTKNVKSLSIDAINALWGTMTGRYRAVVESYTLLKGTFLSEEEFSQNVLDSLAPLPQDRSAPRYESTLDRAMERRNLVTRLYEGEGRGIVGNHSAYDAYMATTEAVDHFADIFKTRVNRLEAVFPGGSLANKKQDVLNNLQRLAEAKAA